MKTPVAGRRGWTLGDPIKTGFETRQALVHAESGEHYWVWGSSTEERAEEARRTIDDQYRIHWFAMAELIEAGDFHGPNVAIVG